MWLLILLMDCLWRNKHRERSSWDPLAKLMARGFFAARMMPVHCWSLSLLLCDRCQATGRQLIHLQKRRARMILLFSLPSMMTGGIHYSSRHIHANLHPLKQCISRLKWMMSLTDSWIFLNLIHDEEDFFKSMMEMLAQRSDSMQYAHLTTAKKCSKTYYNHSEHD